MGATDTATSAATDYAYDVFANLRSVTFPDATLIEYVIDAAHRRVGKRINGSSSLDRIWVYDGRLGIVAELDSTGAVVSRFVYGSRATVPDYMERDGTRYRIVTDHSGSVRLVVNADTGASVHELTYDEFGRVISESGTAGFQPFGFAGGLYDRGTGLIRFGTRDYDPVVGRWTARDPINFFGGDPNLYAYLMNDPINYFDPYGLGMHCYRALDGTSGTILDAVGLNGTFPFAHSQFLYDDGGNSGYGPNGVGPEKSPRPASDYVCTGEHFDDEKLRRAEKETREAGGYKPEDFRKMTTNCHAYAGDVRKASAGA